MISSLQKNFRAWQIINMESTFVKKLASNERPVRDSAIEALQLYLSRNTKKSDKSYLARYQKLWKGLFYAMWFSDRPRPQQRLANTLGHLFDQTISKEQFPIFVEAFWSIIIREWPGIDHHRIDKFYLLLRRVVGFCISRIQLESWDLDFIHKYNQTLRKNVLSGDLKVPLSLPAHILDVYLDELEKVLFEDIKEDEVDEEASLEQKRKIVEAVPVNDLLEVFKDIDTEIKVLKKKIQEDLFEDDRLKEWGVIETTKGDSGDEEGEEEEDYFQ